jgi:hypothetical protein
MLALGCGADASDPSSDPTQFPVGEDSVRITTRCDASNFCVPVCENTGPDDVCASTEPPARGGCWITGGGFVVDADGKDSFGGNGMSMKDGRIRGEWEHVDHGTGNKMHGKVSYLVCRQVDEPGPGHPNGPQHDFKMNQAYYGGEARWFVASADGWEEGYWFDVMIEDHGEPGNKPATGPGQIKAGSGGPDEYFVTVRKISAPMQSGEVVYTTGAPITGGNLQLHPPNGGHPYQEGELPPWVDYAP